MESVEQLKQTLLDALTSADSVDDVVKQYRQTQLPSQVLIECCDEQPDADLLCFAATYHNTPSALLRRIYDASIEPEVHARLAEHHRMPPDYLLALASHQDVTVRLGVAGNTSATPQALETLVHDEHWLVRQKVAANSNLPVRFQEQLSQDIACVRCSLAQQKHLQDAVWESMLHSGNIWVISELVETEKDRERLMEMADSDDIIIQQQLLQRKRLADEVLESLTFSPHRQIKLEAIQRKALAPDEIFGWMLTGDEEIRSLILEQNALPEPVQETVARDQSVTVRAALAQHKGLTEQVYAILATDQVQQIRVLVASNPNLPEKLVDLLIHDEDDMVLKALAARHDLRPEHLNFLVNHVKNPEVVYHLRAAGYLYRHIDADFQNVLCRHVLPLVREFGAGSYDLDAGLQTRLRLDPWLNVRKILAENPSTDEQVLKMLQRDVSQTVVDVANNTLAMRYETAEQETEENEQSGSFFKRMVKKVTG